MMSRTQVARLAAVVVSLAALASCSDSTAPRTPFDVTALSPNLQHGVHTCTSSDHVQSIDVTPATATIGVGGTVQLVAVAHDALGHVVHNVTVCWSGDGHTVSVSETGLVTGLTTGGPVTVTATTSSPHHTLAGHSVVTVLHSTSHAGSHVAPH
jgi:hypothetical protein